MIATYLIDSAHSKIGFTVKHMMMTKVHGTFEKIQGTFQYDASVIENSHVEVSISADSINTHEKDRDQHLKSKDFFDVENFPKLYFVSTSFLDRGNDLCITGNLTMHGVTKKVTLIMKRPSEEQRDTQENYKINISGKTKIKRKDFGLSWNAALEAGGVLVGNEISIQLDVQLIKQN